MMLGATSVTSGIQCLLRLVLRISGYRLVLEFQKDDRLGLLPPGVAAVEELSGTLVENFLGEEDDDDQRPDAVPSGVVPSRADGQLVSASVQKKPLWDDRERWASEAGIAVAKLVKGQLTKESPDLTVRHVQGSPHHVLASRFWVAIRTQGDADRRNGVLCTRMHQGGTGVSLDSVVGVPEADDAVVRAFPSKREANQFLAAYRQQMSSSP